MKPLPPVLEAMTPFPHIIAPTDSLHHAQAVFESMGIRHLPVVENGNLVGLLSDRDLKRANGIVSDTSELKQLTVGDVCELDPYAVEHDTKLSQVVNEMAERKIGSAVVLRHGKVVGIFTTVDACRVLGELLKHHYPDA